MENKIKNIVVFLKEHIPTMIVLSIIALMSNIATASIIGFIYAFVKWKKSIVSKILFIIVPIITLPVWLPIIFITSASIIAWNKPYCIMVYDRENYYALSQLYKVRREKNIREYIKNIPKNDPDAEIEAFRKASEDAGKSIPPKKYDYRTFSGWKDLWLPNFLEGFKVSIKGRANEYETIAAILKIDHINKDIFYVWRNWIYIFSPLEQIYDYGYPKGTECQSQKYFLFKTLFN